MISDDAINGWKLIAGLAVGMAISMLWRPAVHLVLDWWDERFERPVLCIADWLFGVALRDAPRCERCGRIRKLYKCQVKHPNPEYDDGSCGMKRCLRCNQKGMT